MLRFNSSEDCSILWHSASSLRTIIASSVLNRTWVQSVNCQCENGDMRTSTTNQWGQFVDLLIVEKPFSQVRNFLAPANRPRPGKKDYKEAFQDGELSPSARLLIHCVLSKTQTWWLAVSRRSCCASPRSRPTFYQTWLGQWADNWYWD